MKKVLEQKITDKFKQIFMIKFLLETNLELGKVVGGFNNPEKTLNEQKIWIEGFLTAIDGNYSYVESDIVEGKPEYIRKYSVSIRENKSKTEIFKISFYGLVFTEGDIAVYKTLEDIPATDLKYAENCYIVKSH